MRRFPVRAQVGTDEFDPVTDSLATKPKTANEGKSPLVLLGSARSGTTWLQDILAQSNGLRAIFEPLNPRGDRRAGPFAGRYLAPSDSVPELREFLEEAISGRGMRMWWDLRVPPSHVFRWQSPVGYAAQALYLSRGFRRYWRSRHQPRLTKIIRGNLIAGWIASSVRARTLLLVRHPCAVVASQLRLDRTAWHDHDQLLHRYLEDERLVADHLVGLREILSGIRDPVEVHAALWCIENAIPMRTAARDGVGLTFYEPLLMGDRGAWQEVLTSFGLTRAPTAAIMGAPSQQASSEMKGSSFDRATIERWHERLVPEQLNQIRRMLDRFEMDRYSVGDAMPRS
jgi:hypothetical protein